MAISQDIRIEYANNINKSIRIAGAAPVNDNENAQQSIQLISSDLSTLTAIASRINSIIKNQTLLNRFEYKEKARIQKEINAESINSFGSDAQLADRTGDTSSLLVDTLAPMFDDLAKRVLALAESAGNACPGAGIDIDLGRKKGKGRAGRGRVSGGAPVSQRRGGSSLLNEVAGAAVSASVVTLGLTAAYQSSKPDESTLVSEQPQLEQAAQVATPPVASEREAIPPAVTPPVASEREAIPPQAATAKDVVSEKNIPRQKRDEAYKLIKRKDVEADLTKKASVPKPATRKPAARPPTVPTAKNAPAAPAAPMARPAPIAPRQAPTVGFNWPSLFTSVSTSVSSAVSNFNQGIDQGYQKVAPAGSSQNAEIAMNYFTSQGWTREQAAGIVGNLQQESTKYLDPNVTNQIGMYGIAQWDTSRRDNFKRQYKKSIYNSSFQEQLTYIQWELNNTHKKAGKMLKGAGTPEEAARIIQNHYEVAPGQNDNQRIANALALAGQDTAATKTGRALGNVSQVAADFYQKVVGEVTEYVTGKPKNLTFDAGVNLSGMKPGFLKKFYSAVQDYGGPVKVTSAYRSDPYQAQLWVRGNIFGERGIYTPNKPRITQTITYRGQQFTVPGSGKGSRHLMGLAVDISRSTNRGALDPYLRKYGLHRSDPVGDPPHVQQIGGPSMDSGGSIDKPDPGGKNVKSNSKAASVNPPGQPGWSLYNPSTDKPSATIQERRINQYTKDAFKQQPNIIIQKLPSSPSVTMGVKGGSGSGTSNRGGRDVSIDYKRGFGL